MLIIMGGFPFSGKTEFVKQLSHSLSRPLVHINPQEALPENYDSFDQATKQIWNVSAWELAFEQAGQAITETSDSTVIVFDTSASKHSPLSPLIEDARSNKHHILYVFVHSSTEDRKVRTKRPELLGLWESNYANEFKTTIPALTKMADKSWVVKNIGNDLNGINKSVNQITKFIEAMNGKVD